MTDEKASEEELAEARALAETLETGRGGAYPEDALATASFLRYSSDGGELDPERQDAILTELLEQHKGRRSEGSRFRLFGWLALPALAVLLIAIGLPLTLAPEPVAVELPAPTTNLLRAQTELLTSTVRGGEAAPGAEADAESPMGGAEKSERLAVLMHDYRSQMFSNMRRSYGVR